MLVRRELIFNKIEDKRRRYAGIGLMLALMLSIGTIIIGSGLKTMDTNSPTVDYKKIGEDFLTYYSPALIVMALILASSIIGAMTLARREDVIDDQRAD
jgi:NADH:ubiquinone oxidoreductase subunit 6 (subunit J)